MDASERDRKAAVSVTPPIACTVYKVQSLVDGGYRVSLDLFSSDLAVIKWLLGKSGKTVYTSFVESDGSGPEIDYDHE